MGTATPATPIFSTNTQSALPQKLIPLTMTETFIDTALLPVAVSYTHLATRRIRELENPALAGIPILAMTANAFDEDRRNALECGMNGFLSKPIVIADLVQEMRKVL